MLSNQFWKAWKGILGILVKDFQSYCHRAVVRAEMLMGYRAVGSLKLVERVKAMGEMPTTPLAHGSQTGETSRIIGRQRGETGGLTDDSDWTAERGHFHWARCDVALASSSNR